MWPNLVFLTSMACYGWILILTKQLAMKYGAITAMVCYQPVMLATMFCVFGGMRAAQVPWTMPERSDIIPIVLLGLLYAAGQTLNTTAYALGGKVITLSCLGLTLPLFVTFYILVWYKGEAPNFWQIAGYVVISAGVLLLIAGNNLPALAQARQ